MTVIINSESREYFFESEGCYITEISNSDVDPELSIAKARVKPGVTTSWHKLRNTTERYCILSGEGLVEIEIEDITVAQSELATGKHVGPDDIVIIPAMAKQRITNIGEDDLVFLAICTPRFNSDNYLQI